MKKAILAVSFGTTDKYQIEKAILKNVEAIKRAYPEYEVSLAFSSQIVRKRVKELHDIDIPSTQEALGILYEAGITEVIVQPLHLLKGKEYEKVLKEVADYQEQMNIQVGAPLLSEAEDFESVSEALHEMYHDDQKLLLLLGHGTDHEAAKAYQILEEKMKCRHEVTRVSTLGEIENITHIVAYAKQVGQTTLTLVPVMLVAGNHLVKDILGMEATSWQGALTQAGLCVEVITSGIGETDWVEEIFVRHIAKVGANNTSNISLKERVKF